MPKVSIIIRTFNEEKHLGNLLQSIKNQHYRDYEILVVDSGSIDKTLDIAKKFSARIIEIKSRDFTFGYSLNIGCQNAKGEYLVIVSAHTLPLNNKWLGNLVKHFNDKNVAMVYGKQIATGNTRLSEKRDFKRLFGNSLLRFDGSSYYANNANSAIRKQLWQEHNFKQDLFGLEDLQWAKHMIQKKYSIIYEPKSTVHHIHDEDWNQIYSRYRREAIAARQIGLSNPPQSQPNVLWLIESIIKDIQLFFSELSFSHLKDIIHFRYTQWLGTKRGWYYYADIESNKDMFTLHYPSSNYGVVISAQSKANFKEIPLPETKPGDVLIKVAYVGVCRTDLEVYDGDLGYYKKGIAKYPIIPGHEFSGTIVKIGVNNRVDWKIGDRVVGECILSCGKCSYCIKGSNIACSQRKEVGVMNYNGAYAKYIVLPANYIHKIPDEVDLKTASLAEPLAVVLRALRRVPDQVMKNRSKCAVIGAGPIGHLSAQVILNSGHDVVVFDKNQNRLEFLKDQTTTSQEVKNLNQFDLIIEATGSEQALKQVLRQSRTGSILLILGFPYARIEYNFEDVVGNEKFIIGSVGGAAQDFKKALEILPQIDTSNFTKTVLPLHQFSKAWKYQRSLKYLKVLLEA